MTLRVESGAVTLAPGTYEGDSQRFGWDAAFRPRAVVLWWAADCDPRGTTVNVGGIGLWATDATEASTSWAADDQAGPGLFRRRSGAQAFLACSSPNATEPELTGSLYATDEGAGIAVEGRTTTTWHVHALAIGGDDIEAATVTRLTVERPGAQHVDGLGFRPGFLFFLPEAPSVQTSASLGVSVGFAVDPGGQGRSRSRRSKSLRL